MPRNASPNLAVMAVSLLDGHPVPGKMTQALNPCFLEAWNALHKQRHHGVGSTEKGQHMFKCVTEPLTKKFQK